MTYELPAPRGPIRDLMMQAGYIVGFSVQALVSVVLATVKRRLSVYEVVTQTLFIGRVCTGPSLLLMMPIGVFIAVSVGELAGRIGAGGYSGAVPNEKITWCKLDVDTPKFMIQSDASIVAPLIFAYLLGD